MASLVSLSASLISLSASLIMLIASLIWSGGRAVKLFLVISHDCD